MDRGLVAWRQLRLAVLIAASLASRASYAADDEADAEARKLAVKTLYEAGSHAYAQGRFDDALKAFESAYRMSDNPVLLFNMAQAYREKGPKFCPEAMELYQAYLARSRDDSDRPQVEKEIAAISRCAATHAHPTRIAALLKSPKPDSPSRETIVPKTEPVPPVEGAARPLVPTLGSSLEVEKAGPSPTARTVGISLLIAGGAGLVVGATTGILAARAHGSLAQACSDGRCPPSSWAEVDHYNRVRTVSIIGLATAIVGGIGGGLLLWKNRGDKPSLSLRLEPGDAQVWGSVSW